MNSVKLYSNGSAVISRIYKFNGRDPVKITIPVKKDDLDDVVSSIAVLGNVTLPEPPSYTPTNSNPTTLSFDPKEVLKELATKLRGAEAEIRRPSGQIARGKLYGVQTYTRAINESVIQQYRVLLGTAEGIQQFDEADVASLKFTEPFVQGEIDKALAASFSNIKPDSRNVELTLLPNEGAESAAVTYATPCAAWKTRYQLRLAKGAATLEYQAVVDNDTDDDWKDVTLSVVTGEPISFSTDVAEIRRPQRSRVNVVANQTTGAVNAEESIRHVRKPKAADIKFSIASEMRSLASSDEVAYSLMSEDGEEELEVAKIESADVKESGDFSVFTSPNPVTILSRKSAIIGLFTLPLDDASKVLLYQPGTNERRPFSAVKFTNTTLNSLNKGVCEVYVDGERQGKCVLENTKKGEEAFLVYAVETGVKAFKETRPREYRCIRVKISDGMAYDENLTTEETHYRVQNARGEAFQFEIEHTRELRGSKLEVEVDQGGHTAVDTPRGARIVTQLPANGTLFVTVRETLAERKIL